MSSWDFPRALRQQTQELFHQQCWCWGADIRHPPGNLLLEHGFTRTRYTGRGAGSSRYHRVVGIGTSVFLWGFGAAYAVVGSGAVFVDRYEPTPLLIPSVDACQTWHRREEAHGCRIPRSWEDANRRRLLFTALCRWIASYERWVTHYAGEAHRVSVLAEWKDVVSPASEIARAWRLLAWRANALLRQQLWSPVVRMS